MRYDVDCEDEGRWVSPSVGEAGEGYHGAVNVAGDEEGGVSTPVPAAKGEGGVGTERGGLKQTLDLSAPPQVLVERPEEKTSLDVSEKPKSDGDEAGETEPGAMAMAQAAAATEEEELESTPYAGVNEGTVGIEKPSPSVHAPEIDDEADANANANATRTSSRQASPHVRMPNALTGIGSAHNFELDGLGGDLIPDDDEFGIASFAKGLDVTSTTITTTTDTNASLVTGTTTTDAAIDDNEANDKLGHSNKADDTNIDTEMK